MTHVEHISIDRLVPTKLNPRSKEQLTKKKLTELVNDIVYAGCIIVPLIGRDHATQKGKIEILAGRRRLEAAKILKLKTVPVEVRPLIDDLVAFDVTRYENKDRVDLSVKEMATEVKTFAKLLKNNVTAIADRLGISPVQTRRRLQISSLKDAWFKLADTCGISFENLAVIAKYPVALQDTIMDVCIRDDWQWCKILTATASKLEAHIDSTFLHSIDGAPWNTDDETLTKAGPCTTCQKRRTAAKQASLWEDEPSSKTKSLGRCLDLACWNEKLRTYQKANADRLLTEHPDAFIPVSKYNRDNRPAQHLGIPSKRMVTCGSYEINMTDCKKDDKGAKEVLKTSSDGSLKFGYMRSKASEKNAGKPKGTDGKPVETPLKDKLHKHHGLRLLIVIKRLVDLMDRQGAVPRPKSLSLKDLIAVCFDTHTTMGIYGAGTTGGFLKFWTEYKKTGKIENSTSFEDRIWLTLLDRRSFQQLIQADKGEYALKQEQLAKWVAKLIGFDWDKAYAAACEEKLLPKSYGVDRITGKPAPGAEKKTTTKKVAKKKTPLKKGGVPRK